MFQNLHKGARLYILDKAEPSLKTGTVTDMRYTGQQCTTYNASGFLPTKSAIEFQVQVGGERIILKEFPPDATEARFNDIYVTEDREAMIREIESLKAAKEETLRNREHDEQVVTSCNRFLKDLNPTAKREEERDRDMDAMKSDLTTLKDGFEVLRATLEDFIKTQGDRPKPGGKKNGMD